MCVYVCVAFENTSPPSESGIFRSENRILVPLSLSSPPIVFVSPRRLRALISLISLISGISG